MKLTPATLAYRDQLDAAIRDRYDRVGIDTNDRHVALAILTTVGMVCDAACAWDNDPRKEPALVVISISSLLDALVRYIEDAT
jgi:hypothetical protein